MYRSGNNQRKAHVFSSWCLVIAQRWFWISGHDISLLVRGSGDIVFQVWAMLVQYRINDLITFQANAGLLHGCPGLLEHQPIFMTNIETTSRTVFTTF